jgi:hypothetical protein
MSFVKTDGGRECAGFTHEFNDCVVRAISIAFCIDYKIVHAELKALGRKDGAGISTIVAMEDREFIWHKRQKDLHSTVGRFVKEHPIGHYVVTMRGHAISIIDGIIHDRFLGNTNRCHVTNAWKVL